MAKKPDLYISVDIEADGPRPGDFSMLSLGAAAFLYPNEEPVATFEINLATLEGASQHPDTMKWWEKFPEAWEHSTKDPLPPEQAIKNFVQWVDSLRAHGAPVLVTYPAWDYMWVHWYISKFSPDRDPFGIGSLELKSLAMAILKNEKFKATSKRSMPGHWFRGSPKHNHTARQDAIGQGMMLVRMLKDLLG